MYCFCVIVCLVMAAILPGESGAIYPLTGWRGACAEHELLLSSGTSVVLQSPNYPHHYPSGTCERRSLRPADSNTSVQLVCLDVDLDSLAVPWLQWRVWGDFLTLSGRAVLYGGEWSQCATTPLLLTAPPGQALSLEFIANWALQRRGYTCVVRALPGSADASWRHREATQQRSLQHHGGGCGRALISQTSRIVDGENARPGEYPFMVYMVVHTKSAGLTYCAGTLVSRSHVLTAAHCLQDGAWAELHMAVEDVRVPHNHSLVLNASRLLVHDLWSASKVNREHDIGVITLERPVTVSRYLQPVCLPSVLEIEDKFEGLAVIAGWGKTFDGQHGGSFVLQAAKVQAISNCMCWLRWPFHVTPLKMCTRPDTNSLSTHCHGDSGGPLLFLRAGRWLQAGIISFTAPLGCVSAAPAGYTRVTPYLTWLQTHTGINAISQC